MRGLFGVLARVFDFLYGVGDCIGGFEVHVVAAGNDDLFAVGGEECQLGLGAFSFGFEFGGRYVEVPAVAFGSRENDERDVAEYALLRCGVHLCHVFG